MAHVRRLATALILLPLFAAMPEASAAAEENYKKPYRFGEDWFTKKLPLWQQHLAPLEGRANLSYLEVGPYEGRSFFWMIDHVLTHSTSRATAIDIFARGTSTHYDESYEKTFRSNLELSGAGDRVTVIKGSSQVELRRLPLDSYDVIYIDGSHDTPDVLTDIVIGWGLLRAGGLLILDDYVWQRTWPFDLRPAFAINAFISAFGREVVVLHRGLQVVVKKRPDACSSVHYEGCSLLGPYLYDWRGKRRLLTVATGEEIPLTEAEKAIVEEILRGKRLGEAQARVPPKLHKDDAFRHLNEKLRLDL